MTRQLALQDFAADAAADGDLEGAHPAQPSPQAAAAEADALEAYDSGYKNGWADCATAEAEERSSVAADLAQSLSEAKLTYEAARRDVLAALGPFFEDVTSILLPRLTAAAAAPTVLAELAALAELQTDAGIEILAAPSTCASLERLIEAEELEVTLKPETALAEGQVSIRAGAERRDLDMDGAAARITEAIAGFCRQSSETTVPETTLSKGAA